MCYHPNKQTGIGQLAGGGRITTPSSHLSSILMTERDKQSVNAPGVCVITRRTPAKIAHTRACVCRPRPQARANKLTRSSTDLFIYLFFFPLHLSDYSSAGRAAGERVGNRTRDKRWREGGREQERYDLFLSIFHLPSEQWTVAHSVCESHTDGAGERKNKGLFFEIATW